LYQQTTISRSEKPERSDIRKAESKLLKNPLRSNPKKIRSERKPNKEILKKPKIQKSRKTRASKNPEEPKHPRLEKPEDPNP
jgi:hypothetical protein